VSELITWGVPSIWLCVQALDVLEEHLVDCFGEAAIERIDHSTPSVLRNAAIKRFNKEPRYCALPSNSFPELGDQKPDFQNVQETSLWAGAFIS